MSKARQLADLGNVYDDGALSNRNLIINGAMQVAQRGTSETVSTAVNFVADRHKISVYNTGFATPSGGSIEQIDITGTNLGGVTFKNATRLTPNSTWALTYFLQQMEDVTSIADTDITFSIWMRVGSGTLTLTDDLRVTQNFGSGGSTAVTTTASASRVVTTDWQRFTWTMTVPSVSGKTVGAGNYLQLNVLNGMDLSGFSSTLDLTGFQVEVGDTATPFEHRSFGDELARCQRYYERFDTNSSSYLPMGMAWAANEVRFVLTYSEKRSAPSISVTGNLLVYRAGGANITFTSPTTDQINTKTSLFYKTVSGLNATQGDVLQFNIGDGVYVEADAEL